MIDNVIKFSPRKTDLANSSEIWVGESYASRRDKIVSFIEENTEFPPSPNMKYIREGIFRIKKTTTMEQLRRLAERIKEECVIDCFQISINRHLNQARMLFDWYDYKENKCFYLFTTYQMNLSVLIIRFLDLPLPSNITPQWLRYFILREYNDNKNSFKELLERLKYARLSKKQFLLLNDIIAYAEKVCQGIVK
ncbi:MAG: hypothetical protein IJK09_03990 [Prevotella sp.]|nr:hypothetical protein [Prevotella sp.]